MINIAVPIVLGFAVATAISSMFLLKNPIEFDDTINPEWYAKVGIALMRQFADRSYAQRLEPFEFDILGDDYDPLTVRLYEIYGGWFVYRVTATNEDGTQRDVTELWETRLNRYLEN